jgi:hypothetical protein
VSPTGLVRVSWLDRRNDPADVKYQAFAAISTDGGQTFPNMQLTKAFSNPDQSGDPNWMGDYTGNTWAGGDFIAAWMDSSNDVDVVAASFSRARLNDSPALAGATPPRVR